MFGYESRVQIIYKSIKLKIETSWFSYKKKKHLQEVRHREYDRH
jgi:hypothetical protein